MNADKGYKLRKRLQPFIEQDMQVIAELENQMQRRLRTANRNVMRGYFLDQNPNLTEAEVEELLKR